MLDVGAGAGRHSLEAQSRGLEAVAIDISPGAVEVCRRRGVVDARLLPLARVEDLVAAFDTVLLLCGNLGLAGGGEETAVFLRRVHALTGPEGRVVFDTVDPYLENDEDDLAYLARNRERGRLPGHVTIRISYGGLETPWYDLLCVSVAELEALAEPAGWRLVWKDESELPDWYGVLEKA